MVGYHVLGQCQVTNCLYTPGISPLPGPSRIPSPVGHLDTPFLTSLRGLHTPLGTLYIGFLAHLLRFGGHPLCRQGLWMPFGFLNVDDRLRFRGVATHDPSVCGSRCACLRVLQVQFSTSIEEWTHHSVALESRV